MMWIGVSCRRSIRKVNCTQAGSTCSVVVAQADAPDSSARCIVLAWCRHGVAMAGCDWHMRERGSGGTRVGLGWEAGKGCNGFFPPGYPLNWRFEANES
eukprot:19889-Rhodomonas_salina.1